METKPEGMTTLSRVLEVLAERGYDNEFKFMEDGRLEYVNNGQLYDQEGLKIIRTYRFEGDSNPSDSAVLYLLENQYGLIGYIINAYGIQKDRRLVWGGNGIAGPGYTATGHFRCVPQRLFAGYAEGAGR